MLVAVMVRPNPRTENSTNSESTVILVITRELFRDESNRSLRKFPRDTLCPVMNYRNTVTAFQSSDDFQWAALPRKNFPDTRRTRTPRNAL